MRGTFGNIRLRNRLVEGTRGAVHGPPARRRGGVHLRRRDALPRPRACRSSSSPAASTAPGRRATGRPRAPALLGVRAVLAESYERIHRSNLVGMGVLPLQFLPGESAASLGLTGRESYTIGGLAGRARAAPAADGRRHATTTAARAAVRGDRPARRPDRRRATTGRAGSCRRSCAGSRRAPERGRGARGRRRRRRRTRSPATRSTPPRPSGVHAGRRLWDDLRGEVGKAVVGVDEPLRHRPRRAARRRPRPRRGRPGHRQDAARPGGRPGPRPARRPASRARRTCSRATSPARASSRPAAALRRRARSSRTSSSSTRSTGRRRGPSRRCSRRCRSGRSRSRARPTRCRIRSSSSRPRTRSSSRARSRCRRPSSTGSCSGSGSATRTRQASGGSPAATGREAEPLDAIRPVADAARLLALRDEVRGGRASATRSRRTRSRSSGRRASTPTSSSGRARARRVALYRAAQAAALLDGRLVRPARRRPGDRPGGPRPTGSSSTSTGACAARRAESAMAAILDRVPAPPLAPVAEG